MADQQTADTTTEQPVRERTQRTTRARTAPSSGRLAYTRRATAGEDDDLIRAKALVDFWKFMTIAGGIAILWIIVSTSYCVGRQVQPYSPPPPPPPPRVQPASTAPTTPAPAPQVIVIPAQPVQQVTYPPATTAVNPPTQVETRPLSDIQQRNKAAEDRLRRKYGHKVE